MWESKWSSLIGHTWVTFPPLCPGEGSTQITMCGEVISKEGLVGKQMASVHSRANTWSRPDQDRKETGGSALLSSEIWNEVELPAWFYIKS